MAYPNHTHPVRSTGILPRGTVRVLDAPVRVGDDPATSPGDAHHDTPKIELHRRDGRVVCIEVICSCGEVIQVECDYTP